ncbi:DEAD/DEAH box helicase [Actinophytocola sp. NPDC049390]|uniref:DEAD/DEAH box helicase n=1 Tax=Actinophytocola sp. NPDC049390 TaxID=3363894 RepID=UPI00379D0BC5
MRPDVYGDLSADGSSIILVPGSGDVHALRERELALLTPLVKLTTPPVGLTLPLSWPAVVQLAETYGSRLKPQGRLVEWIQAEAFKRANPVGNEPIMYRLLSLPDGLKPRPYQYSGARLIAAVGKVLITDEPGTGKTITTILGLLSRDQDVELRTFPAVVVCPASVVDSWVKAWQTWAPHLTALAWRGTPAKRRKLAGIADVYVASYDTARIDIGTAAKPGPLTDLAPAAVVVDECHLIKSPDAARSKAIRRLAAGAETVVALSGTPITHNPGDLWPTLVCLEPTAWPSRERWVNRYCTVVPGDYSDTIIGLKPGQPENEFRTALLGAHRRVAKADVLDQLPPKVYSVRTVELPEINRKRYAAMERDMLAELDDGQELSAFSVLTQLNFLSALSCADADVEVTTSVDEETGEEKQHYHAVLKAPSWKVDALLEVLEERPGSPVVAFAQSRQLMTLAGHAAEKAGYKVGYIVGGQTPARRTENVDAFQRGELDLICVTTQAGGVGITLTAASTAVFLQRPWSLVDALQAEDRLHRIGAEQHDCIEIIDVVAANTIDSRVREALREKGQQLSDLVQDPRIVSELLGGASTSDRRAA